MIYATGYVTLIQPKNDTIQKKYTRKFLTLKFIEQEDIETSLKVKYTFTLFIQRDYECRFLEDYTGKIKPLIEKLLAKRVISIQVTHLNYVSETTVHNMMKRR